MWLYTIPVAVALPLFVAVFVGALIVIVIVIVIALRRWVPRDPERMSEWDRVQG